VAQRPTAARELREVRFIVSWRKRQDALGVECREPRDGIAEKCVSDAAGEGGIRFCRQPRLDGGRAAAISRTGRGRSSR